MYITIYTFLLYFSKSLIYLYVYCLHRKMATQPLIFVEEDVEKGGKEQAEHEIQNDFAYRNNVHNADIKIRMGKYKLLENIQLKLV